MGKWIEYDKKHKSCLIGKETNNMKWEKIYVRAIAENGLFDSVDAMVLDDDSFRAFILDILHKNHMIVAVSDEHAGREIPLRVDPERVRKYNEKIAQGD